MSLLAMVEFGLLALEMPLGFGNLHSLTSPQPDEIGFEFGDHGENVEEQWSDGIGGIVDGAAQIEAYQSNHVHRRSPVHPGGTAPIDQAS